MINFLPALYEDEMLYSVIARYQRMCGMISKRAMIKDVFGELVVIRSTFFPKHITLLVENLPPTSKLTAKEVINNHTMLPFYTAFLSEERYKFLTETMEEGHGRSIETLLGLGGNKVRLQNKLRYCPVCFKEDLELLGESFFRRMHQIVGAYFCLKHKVVLKDSSVLSTGTGLDYIVADEEVCNTKIVPDPYPESIRNLNLKYISNAEFLMKRTYQRKNLQFIIDFYIDKLREEGLASKAGNLYMNEVEEKFINYYPSEYLEMMQSMVDPQFKNNWLRLFVRRNKPNQSPLRHLLFLQFLNIEIEDFFNTKNVTGKIADTKMYTPKFDIHERRRKWLKLIEENQGSNREELKIVGKGLHSWIYKYDLDWYEKVTPRVKNRKSRDNLIDWEKKDEDCLKLAKEAVQLLLNRPGKPIRITTSSITRFVGERNWFRKNNNLIKTLQFMEEAKENINDFRIRKIKWAIEELSRSKGNITAYKVQLYAGFGGGGKEVRDLIESELAKYE